jgi:hypothetical protein
VDRLAVRMVTDNIVIQFVPPETHRGIAIESVRSIAKRSSMRVSC